MSNLIRKLSSRKLWMAIAGIATGIATLLGSTESDISTIAGAVTTLVSAVVYMLVEGKVDAERVKNTIEQVEDATELFKGAEISD